MAVVVVVVIVAVVACGHSLTNSLTHYTHLKCPFHVNFHTDSRNLVRFCPFCVCFSVHLFQCMYIYVCVLCGS